jgi:hypothetical protein
MKRISILIIIFLISKTSFSQVNNPNIKSPQKYFKNFLSIVEKNYYFIDKVDLDKIAKNEWPKIKKAETVVDVYPSVDYVLNHLHEKHSGFLTPLEKKKYIEYPSLIYAEVKIIKDSVGYVKIPFIATSNSSDEQKWVDSLKKEINRVIKKGIDNWIVDLRGCGGGNFYTMIRGIGALIDEGVLFYNKDKIGNLTVCEIKDNIYLESTKDKVKLSFSLGNDIGKRFKGLAILIDGKTASSGERLAIALRSSERAKLFGQDSGGLSSGNSIFNMKDQALLYLVTSVIVNDKGVEIIEKINPDYFIDQKVIENEIFLRAINWMNNGYY